MGIRVRLCSDWCLREADIFVRLSANICQLHRPNTIPIFCAAVCRDYRLRTCSGFCLNIEILESAVDDLPVVGLGFSCDADVAEGVAVAAVEVGQDPVDDDVSGAVIVFDSAVVILWVGGIGRVDLSTPSKEVTSSVK